VRGTLLVAGTGSDAGKSVLVAGLCRWLARQGVKVAPFKAQNMSLNSFVTLDGAEIGRAQAMQAAAAGVEPVADMNPVLLKPGSDRRSQVVVLGHPEAEADAVGYRAHAPRLRQVALDSLARLRVSYDVVICEGAGSPAEINLRETDVANMGLARAAGLPVIVTGDIDRGGVFAAMYGTLALLSPEDQALICGFVINKFRGAPELLDSGLTMLRELTGRPVYGVLPWQEGLWLDAEDSLSLATRAFPLASTPASTPASPLASTPPSTLASTLAPTLASPPASELSYNYSTTVDYTRETLRVAVVRLPRISNFTDADALAAEPGVLVRFATSPADLADADLVVLPGTRATVADLAWLRDRGLAAAITERARAGRPVLGICGGYQMLAGRIEDEVESRRGAVDGLGLLPVHVRFGAEKILGRPRGSALGAPVAGYEIHHGVAEITDPAGQGTEPFLDGCRRGPVWGTSWHGALENDAFRRAFLAEVAALAGRDFTPAPGTSFAALREARLDVLADLVAAHLDTAALSRLIEDGPVPGLPALVTSLTTRLRSAPWILPPSKPNAPACTTSTSRPNARRVAPAASTTPPC
jgi:adenosylcobyric acid synthase